jgi:hypothetical protein
MIAAAALVALAVAIAALPLPLMDDQALFILSPCCARAGCSTGYWDIKPPGIFLQHLAARPVWIRRGGDSPV